jgi:hypothetical protein
MKEDLLDRIRIASPCNVSWESMTGSERARFCSQCQLHVYDISRLSHKEALALITNTQGRICGRIHRRADGTVLTRDCPVGLRAIRRRIGRVAGSAFAAVLTLVSIGSGQKRASDPTPDPPKLYQIERKQSEQEKSSVTGKIFDSSGAVVVGASVTLLKDGLTKTKLETVTNNTGEFSFQTVPQGWYRLEVYQPGFAFLVIEKLEVKTEDISIAATLGPPEPLTGVICVLPEPSLMSPPGTMILSGDMIRRLPH